MTIGLIDVDGHNFPKLVLMKLLAWRRVKGAKQVSASEKPENPYRKGSIIWSVMEGEWGDLTAHQIAEVLDTTRNTVYSMISKIRKDTGWAVPHKRL